MVSLYEKLIPKWYNQCVVSGAQELVLAKRTKHQESTQTYSLNHT